MTTEELTLPPLIKVEAELCRRRFYDFFNIFWDEIIEDELVENWHIEYLCDELQKLAIRVKNREPKEYDLIINIPPGTTKSTICTIMFPIWCWVIDPTIRIITGSHSSDLATEHASKSRDILRSDKFMEMFPDVREKDDQKRITHYENTSNGSRTTTSVGASIVGKHGHIILVDDGNDPEKAQGEKSRKKANNWNDRLLSARKIDKEVTVTIHIQQRSHVQEMSGHVLKKAKEQGKKVKHICLPARVSDDISPKALKINYRDGLLDPYRLSEKVLQEAMIDQGSYGFAGQYMQRPSPEGGGKLKGDWMMKYGLNSLITRAKEENGGRDNMLVWNFCIDGAYTDDKTNDATALMAWCEFQNDLYIREAASVWMGMPDLLKFIPEFVMRNGYDRRSYIYVEPKANGISTVQMIKRKTKLNIIQDKAPTTSKIIRVNVVSPFVEARRTHVIEGAAWTDKFIHQCETFPQNEEDNEVDCLVMAIDKIDMNYAAIQYAGVIGKNSRDKKADRK